MKKILMTLIILVSLNFIQMNNLQTAQAASLKDNPRLAILPYADKASKSLGLDLSDATVVSEFLMEQFLDSARFKIVEREKMQEILAEHSLNASGLVNPATAVGVGKLAGAQFLVAGSVTGLSTKKSGASYSHSGKGGVGFNSYTVIANITLRIIDIEDGSVVMAVSGTGESARTNVDVVLRQEIRHYYGDDGYDDNSENNSSDSSNIDAENNSSDSINTDSENNSSDSSNIDSENNSSDSSNIDSENNSSDSSNTDEENNDEENNFDNSEVDYYDEGEGGGVLIQKIEHRISIGGKGCSMVQVRNALYKAAVDAVYNKDYGVLAKLDGKAKRRKV